MGFSFGDILNPVGAIARESGSSEINALGQVGTAVMNPVGWLGQQTLNNLPNMPNMQNPFPGLGGPDGNAFVDPNINANKKLLEEYRNRIGGQAQTGYDQGQATRGQQQGLLGQLQARAAGTGGPSVSELQMQKGLEANRNALASQAASAPAGSGALNQRNLMRQQAMAGQQTVADTGMLRAQEQQQAEQSLAGLLGQTRSQDMQQQSQADQLTQQYMQMGLGLDQAQFLANQNLATATLDAATKRRASEQQMAGGLLGGLTQGLIGLGK